LNNSFISASNAAKSYLFTGVSLNALPGIGTPTVGKSKVKACLWDDVGT
jgi:hypothetical protein